MAESDRDLVRRAATMGHSFAQAISRQQSNYLMDSWSASSISSDLGIWP